MNKNQITKDDIKNIYDNLLSEEVTTLKKLGVDDKSVKDFTTWVNENKIIVPVINGLEVEEQFISWSSITWLKIRQVIIEHNGAENCASMYDLVTDHLASLIKESLATTKETLFEAITSIISISEFKENKNVTQLCLVILLKGLNFKFVKKAYIKLVNTLYSSVINYFLFNKNLDINKKAKAFYLDFSNLYDLKIKNGINHLEREIKSWILDWDNLDDVVARYIKTDNHYDVAKRLAKEFSGEVL